MLFIRSILDQHVIVLNMSQVMQTVCYSHESNEYNVAYTLT